MSIDEDGAAFMAAFKKSNQPAPRAASFSLTDFISEESSGEDNVPSKPPVVKVRRAVAVRPLPVHNREEYTYYEPVETAERIVREYTSNEGDLMYEVQFTGGLRKHVTFDELLSLDKGPDVFQHFQHHDDGAANLSLVQLSDEPQTKHRGRKSKAKHEGYVSVMGLDISSSDDELAARHSLQKRIGALRHGSSGRSSTGLRNSSNTIDLSSDENDQGSNRRRRSRKVPQHPTRRSGRSRTARDYNDNEEEEEEDSSDMDIPKPDVIGTRKRKRGRSSRSSTLPEKSLRTGTRQSERSTRATKNMQEAGENDIYRSDSAPKETAPRIVSVKEVFETLPRNNLFRTRHVEGCEVCYSGPSLAPLIYCQGCSLSYHKNCLGHRAGREHLVTKVGHNNYVLQCRRCINVPKKKDPTAPDLSMCQDCRLPGPSCKPLKQRKTTLQEQKDRDENGGVDPIIAVSPDLVNNPRNVLFRCTKCARAYHYHHLPPLSQYAMDIAREEDETADNRFAEYSKQWLCKECTETGTQKVSGIVAWRPSDVETYQPGTSCAMIKEDEKQYLIKWEGQSYFRASWFSGAWTWGVTAPAMRKAYFKREDGPKMRTEDAIPEEYLRIDIVLDVKYTSYVDVRSEEISKARIKEVDKALIKYKGLGYEDAVWEKVPTPEDDERWLDFVTAYNDWVAGRYVRYPKQGPLKNRLEKVRALPFARLEKKKQPENLVGGELMKYQIEGLNWIYYQWYKQNNGILADEMGLGKTIQVIAFMATLIEEHNCFPFLVVVPNSTCANWRREIKQWVPSLRVVTFFGSSAARDMSYKYEMFPEGSKELRAHIVVTSYEAAVDDSCRRIFRGISWAGLIVDEGQRLKNDKSQLYGALNAVKAPFRLLMTGTPLQNNARELFNLLQFLDENINAAELEEKYTEMTSENVRELHDQIRPFILRRTKAQVLTFLPPLGQIIVPISMSYLQKNLYKSILAKNPELLKALFTSGGNIKQQERANLSNILMQLRKCLCHPFVYSRDIEERTDIQAVSHRNLVEASAKLQLLELLLPKLQERGHRVLIFSQFLDMLSIVEDFLDGLQMPYQRLDGTMGSLEKQKRIDQFNAPDSPLFAFLLSTRAGGVGINLATADTVIILDPDFNPHQDIQAISRAHRIGQKKKVLCFQLLTRASVEEKMVQMGRKKMALDHVVVEQLGDEDVDDKDVESILKHGAAELFKDDNGAQDIRYDEASIEKLLDRSQIENTRTSADDSAESQFTFARVWANDQGALEEVLDVAPEEEVAPDPGVWDKILKERQEAAAAEQLRRANALGRGKRARMNVDYATEQLSPGRVNGTDSIAPSSANKVDMPRVDKKKKKSKPRSEDDDTDYRADTETDDHDDNHDLASTQDLSPRRPSTGPVNKSLYNQNRSGVSKNSPSKPPPKFPGITLPRVALAQPGPNASGSGSTHKFRLAVGKSARKPSQKADTKAKGTSSDGTSVKPFERANLPVRSPITPAFGRQYVVGKCIACQQLHPRGACALKIAPVEHCGLCGLAHYGTGRTCPHIRSETQVREMLEALKNSPEKKELVDLAVKYLRGVKGHLVQQKKKDREKLAMTQGSLVGPPVTDVTYPPPQLAQGPRPTFNQPIQMQGLRPQPGAVHAAAAPALAGTEQRFEQQGGQSGQGGAVPNNGQSFDENAAESALRDFLGQNNQRGST